MLTMTPRLQVVHEIALSDHFHLTVDKHERSARACQGKNQKSSEIVRPVPRPPAELPPAAVRRAMIVVAHPYRERERAALDRCAGTAP